jgi:Flp pilus assembly protein TadD
VDIGTQGCVERVLGVGSLIFYVRYARKRDALSAEVISISPKRDYGLAVIFLALGLMSKAMLVTWPLVMLLLDYWPMNRFQSRSVKFLLHEKIPFFGLAAMASGVTFAVQHFAGAMASVEKLSMLARFENGLVSYARYLGKLFWPEKLSVFYPYPGSWPVGEIVLVALLIIAISGIALGKRRAYPFLIMGWLWFLGTLVPVIGLVQVGDQAMADRYTYIPSLGILIIVVGGAVELARRWRFAVVPLGVLGGVVIILCVVSTRRQLGYWRDSETLFQRALAVTENNYVAHNNLGAVLESRGQIDEAMAHYAEAFRLRADDEPAHYNLGNALYKKGQFDEAIAEYQNALRLNPKDAAALKNLGNAFLKDGRADEAIVEYQAAMRLQPGNGFICYDLAKAFLQNGRADEAIKEYRQAILLKPDYAEAHNNLGSLLQAQGRLDEAIAEYQEAIRLKPDYSLAENNLAEAMRSKNSRR